ncbi:MAG: hypothetical protein ABW101_00280 [Candidatus Thiodiazotropha sp.]
MERAILRYGLVGILLSGCNSDGKQNETPLIAVWVTDSCEQALYETGQPSNTWVRGLYQFTHEGSLLVGYEMYADASCFSVSSKKLPFDPQLTISFSDDGPVTLEEGIIGHPLTITMGEGDQLVSVDAYYTINDGSLCVSDAFTLEALSFGISPTGMDAIDFEHCLTMSF